MEEVPRRSSLAPLAFLYRVLYLIGVETEGFLDYQGRVGIISIVRWNLRPVIFGVEFRLPHESGENSDNTDGKATKNADDLDAVHAEAR